MKAGERKLRYSTLTIDETGKMEGMPPEVAERIRWIRDVETQDGHKRKGWATKLMTKVCKEADAANMGLMLEPNGYGDMPDIELQRWYYKHFSFITVQTSKKDLPCLMFRAPR